jgi:hypothetical protein
MDWGWVIGSLVRNAGWTFQQCWEQAADEVFAFLEHLADFPPDYVILARHYGTGNPAKRTPGTMVAATVRDLGAAFGPATPIPADVLSIIHWAESYGPSAPIVN